MTASPANPIIAPAAKPSKSPAQPARIVREADEFMASYARDLTRGDRKSIAGRYDPGGAYLVRNGKINFLAMPQLISRYGNAQWTPPPAFEWKDLAFEPLGADAVVVLGYYRCNCGTNGSAKGGSYHALLKRSREGLRIRIEDETSLGSFD